MEANAASPPKTGTVIFATATSLWCETTKFQHDRFCTCGDPVGHLQQWLSRSEEGPTTGDEGGHHEGGGEDMQALLDAFTEDADR
ncbi:ORF2 [Anelloviridae sp.]|nr:ORF2 [Anelloviridae sp.]